MNGYKKASHKKSRNRSWRSATKQLSVIHLSCIVLFAKQFSMSEQVIYQINSN